MLKKPKIIITTIDKLLMVWHSALFGDEMCMFNIAKLYPDNYVETAKKDFAKMAMGHFEAVWKIDKDAARMISESFGPDIREMLREFDDEEKKKYYRMLY